MSFKSAFKSVVGHEGGYVDDPSDSGGKTIYGITEAVARNYGYNGLMRLMPLALAQDIYKTQYWDALSLDEISQINPRIAEELFDTAVNQGVIASGKYLQRSLNVLNDRQRFYADVAVDGIIGPNTLKMFALFDRVRGHRGHKVLFSMLNCLQGAFYVDLAERREKDERFIFGWFDNRVVL